MYRLLHDATFRLLLIWSALAAFAVAGGAMAQGQGQPKLPIVPLTVGKHVLAAEIAANPDTRARGLMFRYELKENEAMLFVFPSPQRMSFWMKNTPLPLSIAFIDAQGVILNIRDMMPFTTDGHPSEGEALYALEVNRGWFAQRGIKAGDRVQGLDKAGKGR
ncbi:MAG: DUF192 domain-containing protein [Burkholderiales bacterium]|jgi:uncharacterized protein|nr:DUF192 domain-containing protein [Burkholderiales bacterium]